MLALPKTEPYPNPNTGRAPEVAQLTGAAVAIEPLGGLREHDREFRSHHPGVGRASTLAQSSSSMDGLLV